MIEFNVEISKILMINSKKLGMKYVENAVRLSKKF
jgi:hypothetical protein